MPRTQPRQSRDNFGFSAIAYFSQLCQILARTRHNPSDCAFNKLKASQSSQVDSCSSSSSTYPLRSGPLVDRAFPNGPISPNLVDKDSLPSSILSVNGLVFTFRIAYQNSTCSIFVLMLIQSDNSLPSFWKVLPHIMKRGVV